MRRIAPGAVALAVALCTGCTTIGPPATLVAAGAFAYRDSWGAQTFPFATEKVQETLLEGMKDLQMHRVHRSRDGKSTLLVDAEAHDGRHVHVVIRPAGAGSMVNCRVGRFGDEALTRAIIERVGVRLGTLPPAAIPEEPPTTPFRSPFSKFAVPDATMLQEQTAAGYNDATVPPSAFP